MNNNKIDQQGNIDIQRTYAQAQDLQQAGIEMEKSWSAVEDGKDCQQCLENQKVGWIPLNQAFPSGHQIPLGHDGCRCDLRIQRKKEIITPPPKPSTAYSPTTRKIINIIFIIAAFSCLACVLFGMLVNAITPSSTIQPSSTNSSAPTVYLSPVTDSGLTAYVFTPLPEQLTPQYIPSSKTPDDYLPLYGGDRSTYEKIIFLTNCSALQHEFDIAFENNQIQPAGSQQAKWSLGYMLAADDRMREIGCF